MFARVYVETDRHESALVIPKAALSLESIGDTVYVAEGNAASRREVELGFTEGDHVEILSGVAEGESVIVVGQDGLSDGTPVEILQPGTDLPVTPETETEPVTETVTETEPETSQDDSPWPVRGGERATGPLQGPSRGDGTPWGPGGGAPGPRGFDPADMTPQQMERMKELMRSRGLTEKQIEERFEQMRERAKARGQ
jgi:hypothetical protein